MKSKNQNILLIVIIAVIVLAGVIFMMDRSEPEPSTQLGRAMEELSEGVEDAAEEMDPDRTIGEEIGDTLEDFGDDIQDNAQ